MMDSYIEYSGGFGSRRVFGFNYEINITELYEDDLKEILFDKVIALIMNSTADILHDINIIINFPAFVKMLEMYAIQTWREDYYSFWILKKLYTQLKLEFGIVGMHLYLAQTTKYYRIAIVNATVNTEQSSSVNAVESGIMRDYEDVDESVLKLKDISGKIYITLFDT